MRNALPIFLLATSAFGQGAVKLEPMLVEATRSPTPLWAVPFTVTTFGEEELRLRPVTTVDEVLRTVPAFSLFRRGNSLSLNPTAQGVSLRGLGPSGASRSLVLLDGIPLNDAFGGWVTWGKVSTASLQSVEVLPSAGASAWGNAALSGVIAMETRFPQPGSSYVQAGLGSYSTWSAEAGSTVAAGTQRFTAEARVYETDGYTPNAPESRGPVDRDARIEQRRVSAAWQSDLGKHARAVIRGRFFDEDRNNGTRLQENGTDEQSLSARIQSVDTGDLSWNAAAYVQSAGYESTFSSINAPRTVETPASEQFDVPATAWGLAATTVWQMSTADRLTAGADWRTVQGETRENYSFAGSSYTRQRFAGGKQGFAGLFVHYERDWSPQWRTSIGLRGDHWSQGDGHRREQVTTSGAITRDDLYGTTSGGEASPSIGITWRPTAEWRFHASAQRTFRRPTLNELYRPFRVGADQTDANPSLRTEHARGLEVGAQFEHGLVTLASSAFHQDLTDAVANVTLVRGPGTFPDFGFIPAGGSGRRRMNVERLSVDGLDSSATLHLSHGFDLRGAWLWSNAKMREASIAPALVGRRVAETPEHTVTGTLRWTGARGVSAYADVRWSSEQFDDDENRVQLAPATVLNLGVSLPVRGNWSLFASFENVTNERIEVGRTLAGVATLAAPSTCFAGVRWAR